jgi:hypothetical protein
MSNEETSYEEIDTRSMGEIAALSEKLQGDTNE